MTLRIRAGVWSMKVVADKRQLKREFKSIPDARKWALANGYTAIKVRCTA